MHMRLLFLLGCTFLIGSGTLAAQDEDSSASESSLETAAPVGSATKALDDAAFGRLLALSPFTFETKQIVIGSRHLWPTSKIAVCFQDGDPALRRMVFDIAQRWNAAASPVVLDFGTQPRDCSQVAKPEIKIAFTNGQRHEATLGATRRFFSPNVKFGTLNSATAEEQTYFVLHEFGHVLGLQHELRHSQANCWEQIKKPEIYQYYSDRYGNTDPATVDAEVKTFLPVQLAGTTVTDFDPTSIMMYALPPDVFVGGASASCYAPLNTSIAPDDVEALKKAYRNRALALGEIASLSTQLSEADQQVVNALLAYELADPAARAAVDRVLVSEPSPIGVEALSRRVFEVTQALDR